MPISRLRLPVALAVVAALLGVASPASAGIGPATAQWQTVVLEGSTSPDAAAFGMNNAGTIVGTVNHHPAVWDAATGRMHGLDISRYAAGAATAINSDGTMVGYVTTTTSPQEPVVPARWDPDGTFHVLPVASTQGDAPVREFSPDKINDKGDIAGHWRGLIARYADGMVTSIKPSARWGPNLLTCNREWLGGFSGLSDTGRLVGTFSLDGPPECGEVAFVADRWREPVELTQTWNDGDMITSGITADGNRVFGTFNAQLATWTPSPTNRGPSAVWNQTILGKVDGHPTYGGATSRDGSRVVGTYKLAPWSYGGFVYQNGQFITLPDGALPVDVNNAGQIAASQNAQLVVVSCRVCG